MNRPALERTREMVLELKARGVQPTKAYEPRPESGDGLNMEVWGWKNDRGTIGCLAGWMTLDPKLREMGLMNEGDRGITPASLVPFFFDPWNRYMCDGRDALAEFLDLNSETVDYLFDNDNPSSWDAAYERLTEVLEGKVF